MDDREFLLEMERIKEDIEDFPRPFSPCEYFHGRERFFDHEQFKKAVDFFREYQQKRFATKNLFPTGDPEQKS